VGLLISGAACAHAALAPQDAMTAAAGLREAARRAVETRTPKRATITDIDPSLCCILLLLDAFNHHTILS
jgi:hypothetical protein